MDGKPSKTIEDYLQVMHYMTRDGATIIGARLAERIGVAPPTVTATLQRMMRDHLITMDDHKVVHLTDEGREQAESIVRRHALAERLLTEILGLGWSESHEEAHLVEHVISGGDISILYNFCDDAAGDPNDAAYWASTCDNPFAGANVKLISAAGAVEAEATTDEAGVAAFPNVADGSYRIRGGGDRATCAVFVGDQAALAGFQIASGQFVQIQVFGCTKAAGNPGGENPGGENPGGETPGGETPGNGASGNGSGGVTNPPAQAPSTIPNLVPGQMVTQLPSTGVAGAVPAGTPLTMIVLAIAALLLAVGGGVGLGFKPRR